MISAQSLRKLRVKFIILNSGLEIFKKLLAADCQKLISVDNRLFTSETLLLSKVQKPEERNVTTVK